MTDEERLERYLTSEQRFMFVAFVKVCHPEVFDDAIERIEAIEKTDRELEAARADG